MKHRCLFPMAFLASLTVGCANAPRIPDAEEIKAEVHIRSEALAAREKAADWEAASAFFAEDAVVQAASAPQITGREAILATYRSFPPVSNFEGTSSDIIPASSGDMAYEYGVNRFTFETPDGPVVNVGKYLAVWRKIDGQWLVSALAFSDDAPPSPL